MTLSAYYYHLTLISTLFYMDVFLSYFNYFLLAVIVLDYYLNMCSIFKPIFCSVAVAILVIG